jgi:hypothetical protein
MVVLTRWTRQDLQCDVRHGRRRQSLSMRPEFSPITALVVEVVCHRPAAQMAECYPPSLITPRRNGRLGHCYVERPCR